MLYRSGDTLSEPIAASLLRAALDALGRLIEESQRDSRPKRSITEERLNQIESCMTLHLGDPAFGLATAAALCGISVRHVSSIMRKQGTTFAASLRKGRVELAASLLKSPEMRHLTIAEIARICGFRYGGELSRTFSLHYGITPRQARGQATEPRAAR